MKNIAVIIVLFLVSCVSKEVTYLQQLSLQEPSLRARGNYNSYLALEYLTFSRHLLSIQDLKASDHFAKKGIEASKAMRIIPESPLTWHADIRQVEEMVLMQKRLEIALNYPNIKFQLPIQTAHLTYLYDCWISRESKAIYRADELAQCRVRFSKLLDEMEYYIDELKAGNHLEVKIIESKFYKFEIDFDLNSAKFNNKANKKMLDLLAFIEKIKGNYKILIVGNADRLGHKIYNQNLSFRRAKTAQKYLVNNGVPRDLITLKSLGESFPDIITKNGAKQQRNRNVAIYILTGLDNFDNSNDSNDLPLPLIENQIYRQNIIKARSDRGLNN